MTGHPCPSLAFLLVAFFNCKLLTHGGNSAFLNKVYGKLEDAELDVRHGKVSKACDVVSDLKAK